METRNWSEWGIMPTQPVLGLEWDDSVANWAHPVFIDPAYRHSGPPVGHGSAKRSAVVGWSVCKKDDHVTFGHGGANIQLNQVPWSAQRHHIRVHCRATEM